MILGKNFWCADSPGLEVCRSASLQVCSLQVSHTAPPWKLTYRKLFGLYFHSCVTHSAQLLRLASHRSTNAEMFERLFEKLSDITTKTWSRRIEDLSTNVILHLQAEISNSVNDCILNRSEKLLRWQSPFPSWITQYC